MRLPLSAYTRLTSHQGDPVAGSRFGKHLGVDLAVPVGATVYATVSGIIRYVGTTPDVGRQIELGGDDGRYHRFLHLSQQDVVVGQRVAEGQRLGLSGNTGATSTGPHLHWDVRIPSAWSAAYSNYVNPETLVSIPASKTQGGNTVILTEEDVRVLYRRIFNREGDAGGVKNYTGKTLDYTLNDMLGSKEFMILMQSKYQSTVTIPGPAVDPTLADKAARFDRIKSALN